MNSFLLSFARKKITVLQEKNIFIQSLLSIHLFNDPSITAAAAGGEDGPKDIRPGDLNSVKIIIYYN